MVEVEYVAFRDGNNGLTICLIISITTANCILIYKKIRQGQFLYTPRSLIMISLAIGDIFMAMFGLVVMTKLRFEKPSITSLIDCSIYKAYESYLGYLIHFVYGLGLAVLAAEFVQRNRRPQPAGNNSDSIIKSVVYSACPWIIGLIIILPLTMADAYTQVYRYGGCEMIVTKTRLHAMYVVSVILPSILAVLACSAVMFINLSPASPATINSQNANVINAAGQPPYPGSNAAAAQSYPITNTQGPQKYPNNGIQGVAQVPTAPANDTPGPNNGQMFSTPGAEYPVQQFPAQQFPGQQYPAQQFPGQQYPGQQYPAQQYPAQQYPTPQYAVQYPLPQYPVQQYTTQSSLIYAPLTNIVNRRNTTAPPDPVKEKKAMLIVAIIYFICVVPLAAYRLCFDSYPIVYFCLFVLSISRSIITPIIFILVN